MMTTSEDGAHDGAHDNAETIETSNDDDIAAAPEHDDTDEHGESDDDTHAEDSPSREAARYRHRLRETEAERDQLAEHVTTMRRAEAERIAAAEIRNPSALWAADVTLDDLLDDDGHVDENLVRDAARSAADRLGLARPRPGNHVPNEGKIVDARRSGDPMAGVIEGR